MIAVLFTGNVFTGPAVEQVQRLNQAMRDYQKASDNLDKEAMKRSMKDIQELRKNIDDKYEKMMSMTYSED
ncbi:hypothetical protein V1234_08010 [Serratia marcescens]|uniref:hypothetical protein n=1 Tax=Serratia marcescens TaxID=615 RepID=UPI0018D9A431|nr:hypothetical protein [Serratia marcescens]MBH2706288.1 hypothetical protein [Serratia marcescens]MBN5186275.1 hypothetical protein [Serratia marcescens]MBN5193085.1 hypothetical protein [Serratia marcescens]WVJ43435.1 hypothetical protein V1234_08010 [Serratia marcescens]